MAKVTPVQVAYLNDWSGGINTESGYDTVKANELPVAVGWQLSPYGELAVHLGRKMVTAEWTGQWATYPMNLYWYHCEANGNDYVITTTLDGKVWRTDAGAGAPGDEVLPCLTALATPIDMGTFYSTSYPCGFAILDDYVVLTAAAGTSYMWKGTETYWTALADNTLDDSGVEAAWEFPKAATVCSAFARMWAGNVVDNATAYPNRLCWSGAVGTLKEGSADPAGPWNWPATNWVDVNPEDGGHITKVVPFGQSIVIFKDQSMYALVGAGDPTTARLYKIDDSVGCTSPGTVVTGEGYLFWVTSDGAYQYDGSRIIPIGTNNRNLLRTVGVAYPAYTQAAFFWSGYWLSNPYYCVYHDLVQDAWWVNTDGGAGLVGVGEGMYTAPQGGGIARMEGGLYPGYNESFVANALTVTYTAPQFQTGWLPPPPQRDGSQYRLRALQIGLCRPLGNTVNQGHLRVTMIEEGGLDPYDTSTVYVYDLATVFQPYHTEFGHVMLKTPGSPHLCDRFRLKMELLEAPTAKDGQKVTPLHINSITVLYSRRAPKRGSLNVGIPNV